MPYISGPVIIAFFLIMSARVSVIHLHRAVTMNSNIDGVEK